MPRPLTILVLLAGTAALGWGVQRRFAELGVAAGEPAAAPLPVPVEVAPVTRGSLTLRRSFSGALEAAAEFVAAPKVAGRVRQLEVDLGDTVERGQVVALLDDAEFAQTYRQAEAELAVAHAGFAEAESALEIAERDLSRVKTLREEGVTSESQLDGARSAQLAASAHVAVTQAQVVRAESALESARIRLDYARVTADWSGGDDRRIVAQRFVDEGETLSANTPLLSIVELDPVIAVVHVPERDYALLVPGQRASLTTDAYPGHTFEGQVTRIAPVFRRSTRQARVELLVENDDERLKPGMFVRATLELERVDDATIVPYEALAERAGATGVFALDADSEHVTWHVVEVGVREGERVAVRSADSRELEGRVVTLGQALCDDGARVTVAVAREDP